jgi:hypothetical protein
MGLGTSIYIFIKWCRDAVRGVSYRMKAVNLIMERRGAEERAIAEAVYCSEIRL